MASALESELFDLKDIRPNIITEYDLIGFGSGIYNLKPHKNLRKFVEDLNNVETKNAFVFSTSGRGKPNKWLKEKLSSKGFEIIGEFNCKGSSVHGLSKLFGGINKGKPDEDDLKNAEKFAESLKEELK